MPRIDRTMAVAMKKRKRARSRLNIQVPKELVDWAKEYAKRRGTSVTHLLVSHLRELQTMDVPQI